VNRSANLLWLALAVLVPLGMLWEVFPLADASARINAVRLKSTAAQSEDTPLTGAEAAIFAGVRVLKRTATIGTDRIVITVIDGTRNRHAVHDPVFCFRGAGWQVIGDQSLPLDKGSARLVGLRQDKDVAQALYWFSDGTHQFSSPLLYWWKTSLRRLTFGHSGAEPVLVVLTTTSNKMPDWAALIKAWPDLQSL
jgi:hypothetical protein